MRDMLRKSLALLLLVLIVFRVNAQDEACSIFAVSPFLDGGHTLAIYAPDGDSYEEIASVGNGSAALVVPSRLSNEHVRAALVLREDVPGTSLELYTLRAGGMLLDGQVNVGDAMPRVAGWSPSGRYLALQGTGITPESRTLLVDDWEAGGGRSPGAVLEEFGVSWSPGQDVISYVAPDALYAAAPDGLAVWSPAVGLMSLVGVTWLSGTELAVTRCDETCVARISDIFSSEERVIDFGAVVPEGYVTWRQDYLVTRTADRAVGLWNEAEGFQLLTGSARVTSRPTLTSDGRHLSVRLEAEGQAKLLILDLFDSKLRRILDLRDLPELFADNSPLSSPGGIQTFNQFGEWNVREQKFLYTDGGAVHVYDTVANETRVVIEQAASAQWVCPSRG